MEAIIPIVQDFLAEHSSTNLLVSLAAVYFGVIVASKVVKIVCGVLGVLFLAAFAYGKLVA